MENYKVYVHINKVNGKRYYGITCLNVNRRWRKNGEGYKKCVYFYKTIKKYGWDNFEHIILFKNLTEEEACLMEKFYIELYDTTNNEKGYNCTKGGERKIIFKKDALEKMSKANKGKILSEETKQKISIAKKGKKASIETKNKLSKIRVGKNNPSSKKIYCIELDIYFDTVKDASIFLNCKSSNISQCLNKNQKTCKGYHFIYAKDVNEKNIKEIIGINYNISKNCKKVYCIELNMIFNSIKECANYLNCSQSNVSKVLNNERKTCKGYHIIYAKDKELED